MIRLFSGKTVEINNTDAEGRLVLGDGVAYASRNIESSVILDMATLTGAQGIATGSLHAYMVSDSDDIEKQLKKSAESSGELVWPMPYVPETYMEE